MKCGEPRPNKFFQLRDSVGQPFREAAPAFMKSAGQRGLLMNRLQGPAFWK